MISGVPQASQQSGKPSRNRTRLACSLLDLVTARITLPFQRNARRHSTAANMYVRKTDPLGAFSARRTHTHIHTHTHTLTDIRFIFHPCDQLVQSLYFAPSVFRMSVDAYYTNNSREVTFAHACHVCRIVECDFTPPCNDEDYLPLVRGEIILDLRKEEDGWLFGWSYRFGKSGWYPPGYVKTLEHVCSVYYNMQHI